MARKSKKVVAEIEKSNRRREQRIARRKNTAAIIAKCQLDDSNIEEKNPVHGNREIRKFFNFSVYWNKKRAYLLLNRFRRAQDKVLGYKVATVNSELNANPDLI